MKRLFDEDLHELREGLLEMGREVEAMLADACGVMDTRDPRVSDHVVARDARVDRMEREVDGHCHAILVRHQPTAVDHRFITAVLKTTGELERIGDCAKNIARSVKALGPNGSLLPGLDLGQVAELARAMVTDSMRSFMEGDGPLAYDVLGRDDEVDRGHHQILKRVEERITQDPANVAPGLRILTISKNLERVADHATNVAENVIYFLEGRDVRHGGGQADEDGAVPAPAGGDLKSGYTEERGP
jgi:phosphate transport system protein